MLNLTPRLRNIFLSGLVAVLAGVTPQPARAQSGTTVSGFYAIGEEHAEAKPYNFTGRVFLLDEVAIGSGTLIRRHTVLTAGHITFDPTLGFAVNVTFSRGLYGDLAISRQQVTAVSALSGYQNIALTEGEDTLDAFARDQGLLLITDAPVDEDWGTYLAEPSLLTEVFANASTLVSTAPGRFILGYPGVTFDGRTMAYIVPSAPYVQIGEDDSGAYINDSYAAEGGFSGGPIYVSPDGSHQYIVASLVGGITDTTGEFNSQNVRAITKESARFLRDAEYSAGLIKKVKIIGPKVAKRGVPLTYTLSVKFLTPNPDGTPATTDRYSELRLRSNALGTATTTAVTITKDSNVVFTVLFSPTLRSGSTVNLSAYYDKGLLAPKATLAVTLQ